MTHDLADAECLMCGMESVDEASIVFRDELWAAEIVPAFAVPGWFVLRSRRHAERITGLNDDELHSLARRARDLVGAVTEVTGAPATYLLVFGENYPHFHAVVTARGEDVPPQHRSGAILQLVPDHVDPVEAARLVPAVRDAYERASRRSPATTTSARAVR
ncbi:hypothetical protein [Umezawaea sp. Da 62-37]|uniref:hypothetical protein n=1 Tax=Umezawaea sp. Da 62-37 TaxID=3075927 RepID=UPI0028F6DAAB|nr:hypothetical protein [Umezawaea sp. Da 62-37]WNV83008.1 hypothetical protein RM788_33100 [Umezawaea sp. Da 62-37]